MLRFKTKDVAQLGTIGQAIGQVFLQRASVARHQGNLKELSMRTYTTLLRQG